MPSTEISKVNKYIVWMKIIRVKQGKKKNKRKMTSKLNVSQIVGNNLDVINENDKKEE